MLAASAEASWASFPGRNGAIVYGWVDAQKYEISPTNIHAVNPRTGRMRVLKECPHRASSLGVPYTECSVGGPNFSPDGQIIAYPILQIAPP
jgi:hypothetical protein